MILFLFHLQTIFGNGCFLIVFGENFFNWNEANSLRAWCLIQITYFTAVDFVGSRSKYVTRYSFSIVISIKMLDYNVNLTIWVHWYTLNIFLIFGVASCNHQIVKAAVISSCKVNMMINVEGYFALLLLPFMHWRHNLKTETINFSLESDVQWSKNDLLLAW